MAVHRNSGESEASSQVLERTPSCAVMQLGLFTAEPDAGPCALARTMAGKPDGMVSRRDIAGLVGGS